MQNKDYLKLRECPFCGGKVRLYWWDNEEQNSKTWEECDDDNGAVFPIVECHNCDCAITFSGLGYGKEVINVWNRRANDEQREAD